MADCLECGTKYRRRRECDLFCSAPCRVAFNNRRKARGAEMYDLVMAWRFERGRTDEMNIRTVLSNLAARFRDADKANRAGRKSWHLDKALGRIPIGYAGNHGDGR